MKDNSNISKNNSSVNRDAQQELANMGTDHRNIKLDDKPYYVMRVGEQFTGVTCCLCFDVR